MERREDHDRLAADKFELLQNFSIGPRFKFFLSAIIGNSVSKLLRFTVVKAPSTPS